jgi:hypothetical protein
MFLFAWTTFAQSGITFSWDKQVNCQIFTQDDKRIGIEDLTSTTCIRVCKDSQVQYSLQNLQANQQVTWSVNGGNIINQSNQNCSITWGQVGNASITFTITSPNAVITKIVCIEVVHKPLANFHIEPLGQNNNPYMSCLNETLFFQNTSTNNGGSNLVHHLWDFGDGNTSSAMQTSHTYAQPGAYEVTLTVINECGCQDKIVYTVKVVPVTGFIIECPTVVCDNQIATYSVPIEQFNYCGGEWIVSGGTIIGSNHLHNVRIRWDNVNQDGFGWVTFKPNVCFLKICAKPTTVKVPVIQAVGTIKGPVALCLNGQGRYKLPQWPTTEFNWELLNPNDATLILTDQRNEIIISPNNFNTIKLICRYRNTLLNCGGMATFDIDVLNNVSISGLDKVCQNGSLTHTSSTGTSVNWELFLGTSLVNTGTGVSFTHNYTNAGDYVLKIVNFGNCDGAQTAIKVIPLPTAVASTAVTGKTLVCPGIPYEYTLTNPTPNVNYTWAVQNGTIQGPNVGNQVTVIYAAAVTSNQLAVTPNTLTPIVCNGATTTIPIVYETLDAKIIDTTNRISVCHDQVLDYQFLHNTTNTLYTNADSFFWTIAPASAGSITQGQNTNNVLIQWNRVTGNPINATITVTVVKCGQTHTRTQQVIVYGEIPFTITPSSTICNGDWVTFTINPSIPLPANTVISWASDGFGPNNDAPQTGNTAMFQFFNVNDNPLSNTIQTTSATISVPNNGVSCGTSTASISTTVKPGPKVAAFVVSGATTFCPPEQINTVVGSAASNGVIVRWYKGNTLIFTGLTNLNLSAYGYGTYYCEATFSQTGCKSKSNNIIIDQKCNPPCNFVPNPIVTNTSSIECNGIVTSSVCSDCSRIKLQGSHQITSNINANANPNWIIRRPDNITVALGHTATTYLPEPRIPGVYQVTYGQEYFCTNGAKALKTATTSLTIPYVPMYKYRIICNGSSYNIEVTDDTQFFNPVTNRTFTYFRKTASQTTWTQVPTTQVPTATGSGTILNFPAGNHQIRLVVKGMLNGVWQTQCQIIQNISLVQTFDEFVKITADPNPVKCREKSVKFTLSGQGVSQTVGKFLWTFHEGPTAQAGSPTSSLAPTDRVFDSPGQKLVTCTYISPSGCEITRNIIVNIPQPCFNGTITTTTLLPVCKGNAVTLKYQPATANECTIATYTWMNGTEILATTTTNSFSVTEAGQYWVRVRTSTTNGDCIFDTTNRVLPVFNPKPHRHYTRQYRHLCR